MVCTVSREFLLWSLVHVNISQVCCAVNYSHVAPLNQSDLLSSLLTCNKNQSKQSKYVGVFEYYTRVKSTADSNYNSRKFLASAGGGVQILGQRLSLNTFLDMTNDFEKKCNNVRSSPCVDLSIARNIVVHQHSFDQF